MRNKLRVLIALVATLIVPPVLSQSSTQAPAAPTTATDWEKAAGGKLSFDVASIKLHAWDPASGSYTPHFNFPLGDSDACTPTGGLLSDENLPVASYIVFAYKLSRLSRLTRCQEFALGNKIPLGSAHVCFTAFSVFTCFLTCHRVAQARVVSERGSKDEKLLYAFPALLMLLFRPRDSTK